MAAGASLQDGATPCPSVLVYLAVGCTLWGPGRGVGRGRRSSGASGGLGRALEHSVVTRSQRRRQPQASSKAVISSLSTLRRPSCSVWSRWSSAHPQTPSAYRALQPPRTTPASSHADMAALWVIVSRSMPLGTGSLVLGFSCGACDSSKKLTSRFDRCWSKTLEVKKSNG